MVARQKRLIVFMALFLASCAATPKIHLKTGDMTMEVKKEVPFLTSNIAYSPDGKSLLSGSWDNTVRLWDITSGRLTKEFKGHTAHVVTVAFSPDGKTIATAGNDDTVRLWDITTGREIRQFTGYYGTRTIGYIVANMSFSPNGRYIMVPYGSRFADGGSASRLYEVQTGNVIREFRGFFQDFSPDGKYVLFYKPRQWRWGDSALYLVDVETGKEIWRVKNELFSGAVFSPDNRHILAPRILDKFFLEVIDTFSLVLFDTSTGRKLKEFGRVEAQRPQGLHISFSSDGRYVLTGGSISDLINSRFRYKLWDIEQGMDIKEILDSSPSLCAYGISNTIPTFSRDGMSAVMNDCSSLRFYNIHSGEELATFIGYDDGEWLVTTPNGYYNSSEKGDQYLSVTVGGKPYSIAQLRESFYRPDLIKVALSGGSLKGFRKIADIKQPPAVEIVDTPKSIDKDEVVITLKITDAGGGIGDIRLYLNGSAIVMDTARGVKVVGKYDNTLYKTYTVKLTNGLNTIKAIAFNADNTMNSAEVLHGITASFKTLAKPSLYALVIGINEYKNPKLQLNYAVADAGLFADTVQRSASGLFEKVTIKRFTTKEETTNENIIKELKAMRSLNPDDLFVFYVASHGTVDDGEYFMITSNIGSTSTAKLKTDAVSQNTLKELIANIPTTKKLIVIDTCSAGKLGDMIQTAMLTRGMSEDTAMKVLSRAVGSTILMATTSVQEALEGYNGHGVFTFVVSEGLSGKADSDKDGFIKTTELANYIDDEVPALAEKVFKKAQYPTVSPSGMAFPVGRVR